jgi:hypothetical protein
VLASPPSRGFDATAWVIPVLGLVALAGGLAVAAGIWRPRMRVRM